MRAASLLGPVRLAGAALLAFAACSKGPALVEPKLIERPTPEPTKPPTPSGGEWIYIAAANGSAIEPLVVGRSPAWSPDGRRIAFEREGTIHVMAADGASDVTLNAGSEPAWSPDGKKIAFTGSDGIRVMNADGSAVSTIVAHGFRDDTYEPWDMGVGQPAWSPDGARIAFLHLGDGDMMPAQIFTARGDGSAIQLLTTAADGRRYAESDPTWSADGARIVFWSYGYGLAEVSSTGGEPQSLYREFPAVAYGANPAISPDQRVLAFNKRGQGGARSIWTLGLTAAGLGMLITDGHDAAWSPDGSRIAFVRSR